MSLSRHGRDNKVHVWERPVPPVEVANSVEQAFDEHQPPNLKFSMDVNALNFCRFSLLKGPSGEHCLLAVPNLVDSAFVGLYSYLSGCPTQPGQVDVWDLTTQDRLHAAIGKQHLRGNESSTNMGLPKLGNRLTRGRY
jgi:ASTRA-associated protein 1